MKPHFVFGAALYLALFAGLSLHGQSELHHRAPQPTPFVLGPGDQLVLHVVDLQEISDQPRRIDSDGALDLPLIGHTEVAGLTVQQLKALLREKLAKYINNPLITINVTDNQSHSISVLGAVNTPGVHPLLGTRRLGDAISMAGGVRPDAGPNVVVTRQARWGDVEAPGLTTHRSDGYSTVEVPLDALMAGQSPARNILLGPDDVVSIPKADLFYVVGDVRRPGGFPLSTHETCTLLQALSLAEGYGPDASGKGARILRPSREPHQPPIQIPVDMDKVLAGKGDDVVLRANDVLYIPNSKLKASARRVVEAAIGVTTGVVVYRR